MAGLSAALELVYLPSVQPNELIKGHYATERGHLIYIAPGSILHGPAETTLCFRVKLVQARSCNEMITRVICNYDADLN